MAKHDAALESRYRKGEITLTEFFEGVNRLDNGNAFATMFAAVLMQFVKMEGLLIQGIEARVEERVMKRLNDMGIKIDG